MLDLVPVQDLDILHLRQISGGNIANNNDGVVFALVGIVDEL